MKLHQIQQALGDSRLQGAIYSATARLAGGRKNAVADLPDYQELRQSAHDIKRDTLEHIDRYRDEFERNVTARGGRVIHAATGKEAVDFVLDLARQRGVRLAVKSKSMTSEEIHLNEAMEKAGIEAVETDLGEYIIQLAHEKPYHIIAPALHKTIGQVREVLHAPESATAEQLTAMARAALREKFLNAGIGITGANFVVADSGAVVIVENEGNARLSSSVPKIHIAIAGFEKMIPRARDLAVFLKLLARSATGQKLSVYTSFLAGARREGEPDGPEEFYVILIDNGRSRVLADREKRESLYCIRCGACLNHCPVYRKIGGYSYPWVYSGPIGKILTPQFMEAPWLPFASSLCGACAEVCPVKIDIPKILLDLRAEAPKARPEKIAFRMFAWVMTHPRIYEKFAWVRRMKKLPAAGPLKAWLDQRDLPELPSQSFRELWKAAGGGPPGPRAIPRSRSSAKDAQADPGISSRTRKSAARFAEELSALAGQVREADNLQQAREHVQELLAGRSYIASPAPIVKACGFETLFSRESCAAAEVGITSADFALADTGSLVFLSESRESRLISLLPPCHIAVIERDKILGSLDELFARVPEPAAHSSSMVIVTGPSRTADIEMRLVRGVHGPGEVNVIIVNDVTPH